MTTQDNKTYVKNLIEPLQWEVTPSWNLSQYPGSLTLSNTNGTAGALKLEGKSALEGISGQFTQSNGDLQYVASNGNDHAFSITAGSMAAYLSKEAGNIVDQRGLSRAPSQKNENSSLLITPVQLEDRACELTTTLKVLELQLNDQQTWQLWFKDLPFQDNTFDRLQTLSEAAEDINDPEAHSREYNYLNGYEWRLTGKDSAKAELPLALFSLDFYPLVLVKGVKAAGYISSIELVGRLQLPLQNSQELENLSNAVRLVFERNEGLNLKLTSVSIEPPFKPDEGAMEPYGEWFFTDRASKTLAAGDATDSKPSGSPRLEWRAIALNEQDQVIELQNFKLKFQCFGANGWLTTENKLSFSVRQSAINLKLTFLNSDPLAPTNAQNTIRLINATVTLTSKVTDNQFYFVPSVDSRFDIKVGDLQPSSDAPSRRSAFYANLKYALIHQANHTWETGYLFVDELAILISDQSLISTNNSLQFNWESCAGQEDTQNNKYYLLPGIEIAPEKISGFVTLTFTAESGINGIPHIEIQSAAIEAILYARWGNFLPATEGDREHDRWRQIFASSSGDLVIGYTGELKNKAAGPKEWQECLLLNGVVEMTNLISWPSGMKVEGTKLSLPPAHLYERVSTGLQVLYTFQEGTGNIVRDISGIDPVLNLTILSSSQPRWQLDSLNVAAGTMLRSDVPAQKIIEACKTTNEITIELWIKPDKDSITSGAEVKNILNLAVEDQATDSFTSLNFAVTQGVPSFALNQWSIRLRRTSSRNPINPDRAWVWGWPAYITDPNKPAIEPKLTHLVFTRAADGKTNLYINNVLYEPNRSESKNYPGEFKDWDNSFKLFLANMGEDQPYQWLGEYHLVAIYDRALISKEVSQNFQAGSSVQSTSVSQDPPLYDHLRHTLKILYNQHRIPSDCLVAGMNSPILFNLEKVWKHLIIAEHQLSDVRSSDDLKTITASKDYQWTTVQQVSWFSPKEFSTLLNQEIEIISPAAELDLNNGYLRSGLRPLFNEKLQLLLNDRTDSTSANRIILVEASMPLWIRQFPLDRLSDLIALQYLPNGIQQAALSRLPDYSSSDPTDPKWLLLVMPFLGRLQVESEDKLELGSIDQQTLENINPLQVDPILHLYYWRKFREEGEIPRITLALTHWADRTQMSVDVSGLDTISGRLWARLSPLSLEESWFRVQNPPLDRQSSSFQSILASLPETAARLSREVALAKLFSPERDFYPPQVVLPFEFTSSPSQESEQLLLLQGVIANDDPNSIPYGWLLTGILLIQWLNTAQTDSDAPEQHYVAATALPTRLKRGDDQPNPIPQSLAVSPYSSLQFQSLNQTDIDQGKLRLIVAELLCLGTDEQLLRPVSSYTWESEKFSVDSKEVSGTDNLDKGKIQAVCKRNQIILSDQVQITRDAEEWLITDVQTKFTCRVRKQGDQLTFYQDRETIVQLANAWAEQSHQLLYQQSPIAVLRFREIYKGDSSNERAIPLIVQHSFAPVNIQDPILSSKKGFALRSPLRQLRFREAQFNPNPIPNLAVIKPFEVAPPQTTGVQPIFLNALLSSLQGDWGLSALRLSVHYTQGQAAIAGSLANGSGSTLWWQGFQHLVQFRSAKTAGITNAVAGLPLLFRAPTIRGFLPVSSDLPLPTQRDLESTPEANNSLGDWQSVLPGSIQYLLGCVDISAKFNQQGSEINKAEKILRFLLKTRKDAAKVLELVKPTLD